MTRTAGNGQHTWDLTYRQLSDYFIYAQIGQPVFFIAVCFIKISIILFNERLTGLTSHAWRITHRIMLTVIVLFMFIVVGLSLGNCRPFLAGFGLENRGKFPDAKCLNRNKVGLGESLVHILTDVALLAVPITVIARAKMSLPMKIRLSFLFSLCLLSCLGSAMRLILLVKQQKPDFTCTSHSSPSRPSRLSSL